MNFTEDQSNNGNLRNVFRKDQDLFQKIKKSNPTLANDPRSLHLREETDR